MAYVADITWNRTDMRGHPVYLARTTIIDESDVFFNDFYGEYTPPRAKTITCRKVVDGVKWIQRGDTLEWLTAEEYKATLYDWRKAILLVEPATITLTAEEAAERDTREMVDRYVQRLRQRNRPRRDGRLAKFDGLPNRKIELPPEFTRVTLVDEDITKVRMAELDGSLGRRA